MSFTKANVHNNELQRLVAKWKTELSAVIGTSTTLATPEQLLDLFKTPPRCDGAGGYINAQADDVDAYINQCENLPAATTVGTKARHALWLADKKAGTALLAALVGTNYGYMAYFREDEMKGRFTALADAILKENVQNEESKTTNLVDYLMIPYRGRIYGSSLCKPHLY
jgi:hypothetical protein